MSRAYEYRYALEAAARRALEESRIRERVMADITRFTSRLANMSRKGYSAYIPEEMQRAKSEVSRMEQMLSSDYREARSMSSSLGGYIEALDTLAETASQQFHHNEIARARAEKEAQSKLIDAYYQNVGKISNPIVVNFAQKNLQAILDELRSGKMHSVQEIERKVNQAVADATQKAKEWKEKTKASQKKQVVQKQLDEKEKELLQSGLEKKDKGKNIISRIKQLREQVNTNSAEAMDSAYSSLAEIDANIDAAIITEDVRKETVRSIVRQLQQQEFTVTPPQIIGEGNDSFVRIVATKPSGKRAVCQIDLKGKIAYKFDRYEGMTCLKDIERFNTDLQSIYSVKLSDEREIWSNPDRLSKDAHDASEANRRTL